MNFTTDCKNNSQEGCTRLCRQLFDNAPDAIFIANAETGIIEDCNITAVKLLARTKQQLIGMHFTSLHPPELLQSTREKFCEHLACANVSSAPAPIEHLVLRSDGTTVPIEVTAQVITVNNAQKLIGNFRDISKRRTLEKELATSQERLKFAIDSNNDGVWDWNLKTNKVYYSPRGKEILGYADYEIGDDLSEWTTRLHPEDKDEVFYALEMHLRGETPSYRNEHRLRCKDGSYKWIVARGLVIEWDTKNNPVRMVGTHTDISIRKIAELENKQLLQELNEALDQVKKLSGILPICMNCKKIRDDQGYWQQVEVYVHDHTDAQFSHGLCPECIRKLYPDMDEELKP